MSEVDYVQKQAQRVSASTILNPSIEGLPQDSIPIVSVADKSNDVSSTLGKFNHPYEEMENTQPDYIDYGEEPSRADGDSKFSCEYKAKRLPTRIEQLPEGDNNKERLKERLKNRGPIHLRRVQRMLANGVISYMLNSSKYEHVSLTGGVGKLSDLNPNANLWKTIYLELLNRKYHDFQSDENKLVAWTSQHCLRVFANFEELMGTKESGITGATTTRLSAGSSDAEVIQALKSRFGLDEINVFQGVINRGSDYNLVAVDGSAKTSDLVDPWKGYFHIELQSQVRTYRPGETQNDVPLFGTSLVTTDEGKPRPKLIVADKNKYTNMRDMWAEISGIPTNTLIEGTLAHTGADGIDPGITFTDIL